MKHSFLLTLALAASCGFAANRVGPVSQYGQLQAGKNGSGEGRIYGSCPAYSTSGNEVAVQGMSLFWSIASDVGAPFWTADIVNGLVAKQKIQLIRAPMGVDENWSAGNYFTDIGKYQGLMDNVVQAAIDNDIYVIIDYHSHKATDNVENAKRFFETMASKYGDFDNVIFEIFNEPTTQDWNTIKTYADAVIAVIRKYSDNLIVVGNRNWDQYPNEAISNPINDQNIAYTFHFYAGSHSTGSEGANAVKAMKGGLSVFVSEWGTVNADGNGNVSSKASGWLNWMKQYKLSGANWSVSNKSEGASYFNGSAWNYSESGNWVNANVFAGLPSSYTACSGKVSSSSSAKSSSSQAISSSSSAKSSSSARSSSSALSSSSAKSSSSVSSSSVASSSSAKSSSSQERSSSSEASSSSSVLPESSSANSSSSVSLSTDWESNTQLSDTSESGATIGQSNDYNSERQVSKNLGTIVAGESYTLSFDAALSAGGSPMDISATLNGYCADKITVNPGESESYSCKFSANATESAIFKLTMPGSRWETVTISNLSLISSKGESTAISGGSRHSGLFVAFSHGVLDIQSERPANVDIFDMQGRSIKHFAQASGQVSLKAVLPGTYIVRVRSGSENWTRRLSIR